MGGIIGGGIVNWFNRPAPTPPQVVVVQPQSSMEVGTVQWYSYCANKYKSFNPETGFFTGLDGKKHFCV